MPKMSKTRVTAHDVGDFRTTDGTSYPTLAAANAAQSRIDKGQPADGGKTPKLSRDRQAAVDDIDPANVAAMKRSVEKTRKEREARQKNPLSGDDRARRLREQRLREEAEGRKLQKLRQKEEAQSAEGQVASGWYGSTTPKVGKHIRPGEIEQAHRRPGGAGNFT